MAKQNVAELFGLFGKKEEEKTHQQHGIIVDPHVAVVSTHEQGHVGVGEVHPTPVSHDHIGEPYPVPVSHEVHPALMSHEGEGEKKTHKGGNTVKQGLVGEVRPASLYEDKFHGENEKKTHEELHHTNTFPSDEEEDEKGEKKKNKSKLHGRLDKEEEEHGHGKAEEEAEKIEKKVPGHHKEEEKGH
ncbi:uncharacterized protein LOC131874818 [Cryptomeria japonica]|uniref:uncharacterized protein LOC131874818 n=1 Tax=Cryptomeria japonica TaxID=3369 RepID=UPI0027DA0716|nr:uncharacterized protein LOC131874818 [Cryptomeria japonica]